jgi:hypothetical protein
MSEIQQHVPEKEKRERPRRRLTRAQKVALVAAVASVVIPAECAMVSQLPKQQQEPSCLESPFQIDCNWNPVLTPTVTPTPVPEWEPTQTIR